MTIEKRIVVGTGDVIAVTLKCNHCDARLSSSPERFRIPNECPQCASTWLRGEQRSFHSETSQQANFLQALKYLRANEEKDSAFRVLLEFEAPQTTQQ